MWVWGVPRPCTLTHQGKGVCRLSPKAAQAIRGSRDERLPGVGVGCAWEEPAPRQPSDLDLPPRNSLWVLRLEELSRAHRDGVGPVGGGETTE